MFWEPSTPYELCFGRVACGVSGMRSTLVASFALGAWPVACPASSPTHMACGVKLSEACSGGWHAPTLGVYSSPKIQKNTIHPFFFLFILILPPTEHASYNLSTHFPEFFMPYPQFLDWVWLSWGVFVGCWAHNHTSASTTMRWRTAGQCVVARGDGDNPSLATDTVAGHAPSSRSRPWQWEAITLFGWPALDEGEGLTSGIYLGVIWTVL